MKPIICRYPRSATFLFAAALCISSHAPPALLAEVADEDFLPVGQAVVRVMENRDAKKFAEEISPAIKDFPVAPVASAEGTNDGALGPSFQKGLDYTRGQMAKDAGRFLDKAEALGLTPSQVRFRLKQVTAQQVNMPPHRGLAVDSPWRNLRWAYQIQVTLVGEPVGKTPESQRLRGEYQLLLESGYKFPSGWRCQGGIRWKSLPPGVVDDQTQRELALLDKWTTPFYDLTLADDPALSQLGEVIVRFLRARDEKVLIADAMGSFEEQWTEFQKMLANDGQKIPPRKELEDPWRMQQGRVTAAAKDVLLQGEWMGLMGADIQLKDVIAKMARRRGGFDTLENITCQELLVTLSVRPGEKAVTNRVVSGDYQLSAMRAERKNGRWVLPLPIQWKKFPEGLLSEKESWDLAFENYVAKRGTLPPGTTAPDVQFVRLDQETKSGLAEFKNKLVVLEFWATWCGPCQKPMAELQTLRARHPDWKDRVAIISLSLDDSLQLARDHLAKRGWTNTFSAWAGPGGWTSEPAKAYRLSGIPTAYVISAKGKVLWAGHPMENMVLNFVERALNQPDELEKMLAQPWSVEALRQAAEHP